MEYILVTGGLGFIGSHICVELLNDNYHVIVIDNLSNSSKNVKSKIEKLTNKKLNLHIFDLKDKFKLEQIFKDNNIKSVIHLAGLKSVNESIEKPLLYYQTNIITTLNLLSIMEKYNCHNMVFSSSSTVYGNAKLPLTEKSKTGEGISNPYGQTKYMIENILRDYCHSNENFNCIILRYFNPIGAHYSSIIGENPNNIPNNLMPYLLKVAIQSSRDDFTDIGDFTRFEKLSIFGDDYDTEDGTCIRDYIHVVDVAKAHVKAIQKIDNSKLKIYNIGTGIGTSVLELVNTFVLVNDTKVNYEIVGRRKGDRDILYCDNKLAIEELDWEPKLDLADMCRDAWNFQLSEIIKIEN